MLLIQKTFPPKSLIDFNHPLRTTRSNPLYDDGNPNSLNATTAVFRELKQKLETEQRGLCCYCMQIVTDQNSIVEHFLPQKMFPEYQTDYYNLYLSCTYSSGKGKEKHCDIHKGNELIAKLMSYQLVTGEKCQDLFQYDENDGSILPNDSKHRTLKALTADFINLQPIQKEVLCAIAVLNLNAVELKQKRLKYLKEKLDEITPLNKINLEKKKNLYETALGEKFAGVAIYFINERLKRL